MLCYISFIHLNISPGYRNEPTQGQRKTLTMNVALPTESKSDRAGTTVTLSAAGRVGGKSRPFLGGEKFWEQGGENSRPVLEVGPTGASRGYLV